MFERKSMTMVGRVAGLLLACGVAGSASAQESKLTMSLSASSVSSGETVGVDVYAVIPDNGYALAEAQFDMFSPWPMWTSGTSGVLAGNWVHNAGFHQAHMPFAGVFADPSNPIRVWHGDYRADVAGPAFLKLEALPGAISYYPSELTSSSVSTNPWPGRAYLWVDPVEIPGVGGVAPGVGTRIAVGPDGVVTATPEDDGTAVLIGLLLPAVQNTPVPRAGIAMEFTELAVEEVRVVSPRVILECTDGTQRYNEEVGFVFTREQPNEDGDELFRFELESTFGLTGTLCFFRSDGELVCVSTSAAPIRFDRFPLCLTFEIVEDELGGGSTVAGTFCDWDPIQISIPGVYEGLATGPIEVRGGEYALRGILIGLDGESVQIEGLPAGEDGRVNVRFTRECPCDRDGDGFVTVADYFVYLNEFFAQLGGGAGSADLDGDGMVSIADYFEFLNCLDAMSRRSRCG